VSGVCFGFQLVVTRSRHCLLTVIVWIQYWIMYNVPVQYSNVKELTNTELTVMIKHTHDVAFTVNSIPAEETI
jgi:hypothetical protein